jgi:hypothetical protein
LIRLNIILNCIVVLLFWSCKAPAKTGTTPLVVKTGGDIINVMNYGAKGDGIANDYFAIQNAIAELNMKKTGILFFPKGTYRVDEVFRQTEMGKVLNGRSHFIITGVKNFAIRGEKGTVISIKGDFHKKVEWEIKERNAGYSYTQQISFLFNGCKNVTIENLEIDGNCDQMTREMKVTEGPSMGLWFGASISDENENVTIKNVYIHHMATDGICWKGKGGGLYMENVILKNNGRCALSIVQGKNMRFVNCEFAESGLTGKYISHSPNTGVDIENESFSTIENIYFKNCRFVRNTNTQLVATGFDGVGAGRTTNVHLDSCYFEENRAAEEIRDRAVMITTDNSSITNSTIVGTLNFDVNGCSTGGQPENGVLIKNCSILTKGYGIRINCDFKVRIENCTIEQLPNLDEVSANVPFPYIYGGNNVVVDNNEFIYNSSNWRLGHESMKWDLDNYYLGCRSIAGNTIRMKEEPGKSMPPGAVFMIMLEKRHAGKNRIVGTDKIIFTGY